MGVGGSSGSDDDVLEMVVVIVVHNTFADGPVESRFTLLVNAILCTFWEQKSSSPSVLISRL